MPALRWKPPEKLIRSVLDEFRRIENEPLDEEELRRAKDHLKGATLLALEGRASACPASRATISISIAISRRRN